MAVDRNDNTKTTTTDTTYPLAGGSTGKPRLHRPSPKSLPPENALYASVNYILTMSK